MRGLVALVLLAIPLTCSAASRHLRVLQPQTGHGNTTSIDSHTHNATTTTTRPPPQASNNMTTGSTNTTSSSNAPSNMSSPALDACNPVAHSCVENLRPVSRLAHNDTAEAIEKDQSIQAFCATDCGRE